MKIKIFNKVKDSIDFLFDILFSLLSIITIIFALYNLGHFFVETYHEGIKINNLFEIGLLTLISVKFYAVLKDYIGDHHIEINNLVEIGLVAILSELIFKLESYTYEEIIIRFILLIILMVFFIVEKGVIREEKSNKKVNN